jgi:hypothetical protein
MLCEDDRNILLPTGLNYPQKIFQDGLDNSLKKVLDIDNEEGSVFRIDHRLPRPIGFQFSQDFSKIELHLSFDK